MVLRRSALATSKGHCSRAGWHAAPTARLRPGARSHGFRTASLHNPLHGMPAPAAPLAAPPCSAVNAAPGVIGWKPCRPAAGLPQARCLATNRHIPDTPAALSEETDAAAGQLEADQPAKKRRTRATKAEMQARAAAAAAAAATPARNGSHTKKAAAEGAASASRKRTAGSATKGSRVAGSVTKGSRCIKASASSAAEPKAAESKAAATRRRTIKRLKTAEPDAGAGGTGSTSSGHAAFDESAFLRLLAEVSAGSLDQKGAREQLPRLRARWPKLGEEQLAGVAVAEAGLSVFLVGGAGTGKTEVMKCIIECLQDKYGEAFSRRVLVTATTGTAAKRFDKEGKTLASALGYKVPWLITDFYENMLKAAAEDIEHQQAHQQGTSRGPRGLPGLSFTSTFSKGWKQEEGGGLGGKEGRLKSLVEAASVLIIDEVSMLSAEAFEMVNQALKLLRGSSEEFGGLQLVLSGDMLQLPPIVTRIPKLSGGGEGDVPYKRGKASRDARHTKNPEEVFYGRGMVFEAPSFGKCGLKTVILTKVYRQATNWFIEALNNLRDASPAVRSNALKMLADKCKDPLPERRGIVPTKLLAHNKAVDSANQHHLDRLQMPKVVFSATDMEYTLPPMPVADMEPPAEQASRCRVTQQVETDEKRAQNKQDEAGFLETCPTDGIVELKTGAQVMLLRNVSNGRTGELKYANGSRGVVVRFRKAATDATRFALNKSLEDRIEAIIAGYIRRNEDTWGQLPRAAKESHLKRVQDHLQECGCAAIGRWLKANPKLPEVRFLDGSRYDVEPLIHCESDGHSVRMRVQVPLRLSWAITIHKSQGMSLDYLVVDLRGCWCEGQIYVALSRACSPEGLQIINPPFNYEVKVNAKALQFHSNLRNGHMVLPHSHYGDWSPRPAWEVFAEYSHKWRFMRSLRASSG